MGEGSNEMPDMNDTGSGDFANVVPMDAAAAVHLGIIRARKPEKPRCYGLHKKVSVDSEERLVECAACGHIVDPFDYLEQWAIEGERKSAALAQIETLRRIAQAEHDDLMRKVVNLRQRLKRAGQPQPEVERAHYQRQRWNPHLVPKVE